MPVGHLCVISGEVSVGILCSLFNQMMMVVVVMMISSVNYMSSLYILDINPLLDIHFANVFFHLRVVAHCFDL